MPRSRLFLMLGAVNAALAILAGAFGAHALREMLEPARLDTWNTAVQYHFWHAAGLILVGLAKRRNRPSRVFNLAAWSMLAGILLFCVTLYVLALTGIRQLGMVAPLGGLAFLAAWLLFAVGVARTD